MIARWNIEPHNGGGYSPMPAPTFGQWVKYEDHQQEVAELKRQLKESLDARLSAIARQWGKEKY